MQKEDRRILPLEGLNSVKVTLNQKTWKNHM